MKRPRVLPRAFYRRPTLEVAREILGKVVVHRTPAGTTAGIIVEVEAYRGEDDPACHAASGLTPRNAPLYGPPGCAYVYLTYGLHELLNAVTDTIGYPSAVLIRALSPVEGLPLMRRRRQRAARSRTPAPDDAALCRGPANLTVALGVTRRENLADLCSGGPLTIEDRGIATDRGVRVDDIRWSGRIGVAAGGDRSWRASLAGHPAVSPPVFR